MRSSTRERKDEHHTMTTNSVGLSKRAFTDADYQKLRAISDKYEFSSSLYCAIAMHDILTSEDLTQQYITKTRQFEEDQRPASIEDMKALREAFRKQEEELHFLRAFKKEQESVLNGVGR